MAEAIERYHVEVPKYSHAGSGFTRVELTTTDRAEAIARADRERRWARFAIVTDDRGATIYTAPAPVVARGSHV